MQESVEEKKETEIGLIPEDWRYEKLEEHLEQIRGGTSKSQNQEGIGFPVTRIETISDSKIDSNKVRHIKELTDKEKDKFLLRKEDILISHINSEPHLGKSAIYEGFPENLVHGMNLVRIRTEESLDAHFVNNLFKYYRKQGRFIAIASRAVNQSSINQGKMKNLEIPIPPVLEQQRIVSILSTVQDAIEQTEAVIQATRELKKSMMKHLFTYGPVPVDQTDQVGIQKTDIGSMPDEWEILELEKIATLKRGKDLTKKNMKEGEVPVVGSSGVIGFHNESVSDGPGVTVGRSGSVGNLTYVNEDYWPHNTSLFVKDFNGNDHRFIYYLLHRLNFEKYATGVSVPTLNRNFVHGIKLGIPNKSTQKKIIELLDSVEKKLSQETDNKKSLEILFNSLLKNLMTAKVRVV